MIQQQALGLNYSSRITTSDARFSSKYWPCYF